MERNAVKKEETKAKLSWAAIKDSWEYKLTATLLRLFIACCVGFYFFSTSFMAYTWARIKVVELRDSAAFEIILADAVKENDYDTALRWIAIRPDAETPEIDQVVERHASELPSIFFIRLAARFEGEERLYRLLYGKYRLRYDLLRCGDGAAILKVEMQLDQLYKYFGGDPEMENLLTDKTRLAQVLQRVLDYDARHPARNDPRVVCEDVSQGEKNLYVRAHESRWAATRHLLRGMTEKSIDDMKKQ